MIVWGGSAGSSNYFNTGGRYDPVADTWFATSTQCARRSLLSHCSMERKRNDRLGRNFPRLYRHGGEILRTIWSHTLADSYAFTEPYSYSMHGEMRTNAKAASDSRTATLTRGLTSLYVGNARAVRPSSPRDN